MLSFFEADNEDLSKRYLPQVISDELIFQISSAYETVVLQYTLQHHDGIRVLKITSPKSINIHFHLVLPTILSLQSLTELEISGIELNGKPYCVSVIVFVMWNYREVIRFKNCDDLAHYFVWSFISFPNKINLLHLCYG